ncbi:hypothetical protein DQ384_29260 [Sphaerisporangium album]|uniref:Uncharacterized protein n=1 Tax=Sphaerisporangium album TaxID=509200 RepID=A0A367FA14_9ACTN|nr:hypothetical protein [Sphaerisporangium album]RCG26527.1 hypothetical protein DQ384_29260 [Sphaerisporangium album]
MVIGRKGAELRIPWFRGDEVSETTAEKHDAALGAVQRLLKAQGVRSQVIHVIHLKLSRARPLLMVRTQVTPELAVHRGDGQVVAVVSMGTHSGCYLVTVRGSLPDVHTVRRRHPERVADLVAAALHSERAAS